MNTSPIIINKFLYGDLNVHGKLSEALRYTQIFSYLRRENRKNNNVYSNFERRNKKFKSFNDNYLIYLVQYFSVFATCTTTLTYLFEKNLFFLRFFTNFFIKIISISFHLDPMINVNAFTRNIVLYVSRS